MATGVPKKRRTTNKHVRGSKHKGVELTYDHKKSADEILQQATPAALRHVWSNDRASPNRLLFGDNLGVLSALVRDPHVCGRVRLVYIDPPFATESVFHSRKLTHAYEDTASGAEFIESLRERLILLHRLLADDGSLYVHLDEKMVFQMKVILDEVFGPAGYRNVIVRKKCNPKNYTRRQYGNIADFILFYTKSDEWVWNRPFEPWTEGRDKEYQYADADGRRFMKVPVHAPGVRHGETGGLWRGMLPPPGKHWQFAPKTLDEMDKRGEIYWSPTKNPRRKVYLDGSPGVNVQDIWMEFRDAHNQNICITGYPTEKNPELLRRIIQASSNRGDIVLDCFVGSGTTLAVADQLGRNWIGIDNSTEALKTTLERFAIGTTPMGNFVNGRNGRDKSASQDLFSELDSIDDSPERRSCLPLPRFQVIADSESFRDARSVVDHWCRLHGSKEHRERHSEKHDVRPST